MSFSSRAAPLTPTDIRLPSTLPSASANRFGNGGGSPAAGPRIPGSTSSARTPAGLGLQRPCASRLPSDAASASISYTGAGFKPRAIQFVWADGTNLNGFAGVGFADSTGGGGAESANSANGGNTSWPTPIMIGNAAGSAAQTATVSSFDTDGFTLAWTKVGSPNSQTITVYAHCWG